MNKSMLEATVLFLTVLWMPKASALCSVSATPLAFGSFNPLTGSNVDATGTITVSCLLQLSSYTIALSTGGSGTYSPRRMANGGNTLEYNLYTNATYTSIWGDGNGGTFTVPGAVLLGSRDHTVYGRIPISTQRGAVVGAYSDSITVTITYGLL